MNQNKIYNPLSKRYVLIKGNVGKKLIDDYLNHKIELNPENVLKFNGEKKVKRRWKLQKKYKIDDKIPKFIHQIWIGNIMPSILNKYTSSFKNMEGYGYKIWTNKDLTETNFPKTWKYIDLLLNKKKIKYASIADLMRLELLFWYGGIYVDTSFEAIKNLDVILDNYPNSSFIMSNESNCGLDCKGIKKKHYISNSFIISKPGYIVLERLLSEEYLSNINFRQKANFATGPYYVRTGILNNNEVTMIPTNLVYSYNYDDDEENEKFFEECFSHRKRKGYRKYSYNDETYYIKFPCKAYPNAVLIKNFEIGGSWKK
jgi:mannosyltransferase OCH1-like enzyme